LAGGVEGGDGGYLTGGTNGEGGVDDVREREPREDRRGGSTAGSRLKTGMDGEIRI
jgi:hypothetical protein